MNLPGEGTPQHAPIAIDYSRISTSFGLRVSPNEFDVYLFL
jgi:hypothetical protein